LSEFVLEVCPHVHRHMRLDDDVTDW